MSTKTRANSFLLCILFVAGLLAICSPAGAATGDLLAQGAGDRGLWLAQAVTDPTIPNTIFTLIRFRSRSAETWSDVALINGRVSSIAPYGTQLAVLQETGDWSLVWPDGSAIGQPIPAPGRIHALAGDDETLWALAVVTGEPPATHPTTEPTTEPATTLPAIEATTAPAPFKPRWMLYRLGTDGWQPRGEIDAPLDVRVSLAVDRENTFVAMQAAGGPINLFLNRVGQSTVAGDKQSQLATLSNNALFMLWTANEKSPGAIRALTSGGPSGTLATPKGMPADADRTIAISTGRLRLLFTKTDQGKTSVLEQKYDLKTLQPIDDPAVLPFPVPQTESVFQTVFSAIVMAALVFSVIASFQHRRNLRELMLRPDRPEAAPLGTRLLSGLIDLLPMIIAAMVIYAIVPSDADPTATAEDPRVELISTIGMVVYLLHTTLAEAITGRSIGKMITGLKVVGLDGEPAKLGALILRNLLRIIDLPMIGLMFISPLRQRAGDMAAGTLVVAATKPSE